jgi:hypothetical protein
MKMILQECEGEGVWEVEINGRGWTFWFWLLSTAFISRQMFACRENWHEFSGS